MKKKLLKLLRLYIMTKINHNEEYYINMMLSQNINYTELSHNEISLFVAVTKKIEADLLIEAAFTNGETSRNDFDYSKLIK